jgi:hypothetical protein
MFLVFPWARCFSGSPTAPIEALVRVDSAVRSTRARGFTEARVNDTQGPNETLQGTGITGIYVAFASVGAT